MQDDLPSGKIPIESYEEERYGKDPQAFDKFSDELREVNWGALKDLLPSKPFEMKSSPEFEALKEETFRRLAEIREMKQLDWNNYFKDHDENGKRI